MRNEMPTKPVSRQEEQTIASFDWQWRHLAEDGPPGDQAILLWAPGWREKVDTMILDELGLAPANLAGKKALDVGCGQGRWAYGLKKIGCDVLGIDTSPSAIELARKWGLNAKVMNLFEISNAGLAGQFDLVWCWGVIHHTADPERAFRSVVDAARRGGLIHCYVYSRPRSRRVRVMREVLKPFGFSTRRRIISMWIKLGLYHGSVHEGFDALSPSINKEIGEHEIKRWCEDLGLDYERRYPRWASKSEDIFFNARRDDSSH